ncbi:MAG: FdhD protein [Archaeoglobi archaeon]|nr:FdhD protein [Archaeoglobi archaeon]
MRESSDEFLELREALRRERGGTSPQKEWVPREVIRRIFLNDIPVATLVCSPGYERELGAGFCFSEGFIKREELEDVIFQRNEVRVLSRGDACEKSFLLDSSGCIGTGTAELPEVKSELRVHLERILDSVRELSSEEYEKSKGVHTACFFRASGELVKRVSDVGRSNALDKLIGWCLLNDVELSDGFVLMSGRHSLGTMMKIARAGIPVAVSKASALSMAVEIADICKITLCSFADGEKIVIYTHPERII